MDTPLIGAEIKFLCSYFRYEKLGYLVMNIFAHLLTIREVVYLELTLRLRLKEVIFMKNEKRRSY